MFAGSGVFWGDSMVRCISGDKALFEGGNRGGVSTEKQGNLKVICNCLIVKFIY